MPPNIVYIHSHDTGRLVQPYGYAVPTPNLQRLAEGGVLFRQAFCAAPTCSPSRAALLTGQCAHRSGMTGLAHRGFVLNDYEQLLSHTLRRAGYQTVLAGFQHVAHAPYADPEAVLGYDRVRPAGKNRAEQIAAEFLRARPDGPFFLDVGFVETHRLGPPEGTFIDPQQPQGDGRYVQPPPHLPDTPDTRRDMADFIAAAGVLDGKIGIVLDALAEAGLEDRTLVICTTDHGVPFPGAKCGLSDQGTGVMLIVRGPGGFAGGRVVDAMVSHLDLYPTICELAGIEPPPWLEGRSLLPLVRGQVRSLHQALFAEVNYHSAYEPQRSVRTDRWKYIRRFDDRRRPTLTNMDDGISKTVLFHAGFADQPVANESLFDLLLDPLERCNLADSPRHAGTLAEMRDRLERWMRETDDPLLAGAAPAPPEARITPADSYSPSGRPEVGPCHQLLAR